MANQVHLVKQSNGVELPVPVGETSLGRGPFLEVTDKRVSRLHATLKLEDGQLTLCPKHKNPCFYKPTGESKFQALPKDEWRDLSHGDCFSLLPDDLVFSVKYETTETKKQTSRITQSTQAATDSGDPLDILFSSNKTTDTDGSASNSGKAIMEPDSPVNKEAQPDGTEKVPPLTSTTPSGANSATENTVRAKESVVKPTLTSSQSGSTGKRRALPSWLSELASEETREVSAAKKRKAPSKASVSKKKDEDEELAPPFPKVRKASVPKKKDDDEELAPPPSKKKVSKKASAKVNTRIDSEDSKSLSPEVTFGASAGKDKSKDSNAKTMSDEGDTKTSKDEVSDAKSKPLCPYGPSCYRKNPVHFKEYSHDLSASASASLDSVDDSDDDLDKPICPYGRDCYRILSHNTTLETL